MVPSPSDLRSRSEAAGCLSCRRRADCGRSEASARQTPCEKRISRGVACAFTLIELLVAASITVVLAGFIFVIVRNVATTWTRASGRLGADAQARVVLEQLATDLQGAQFRDDGGVWFAASILDTTGNSGLWVAAQTPNNAKPGGATSLVLNTPSIADARFGQAGVWLRFFTTSRGANTSTNAATISAPVAVGYQIVRRFTATNSLNQSTAYLLHRAEARPGADSNGRPGTLEAGYDLTDSPYVTGEATNNGSVTGDPRSVQVPGTNTGVRNLDSVLADNVIDFGIRCYVRDATQPGGLRLIFPANASGSPAGNANTQLRSSLPPTVPITSANFTRLFPDVVDVMIRVLTEDGAQLIANMEKSPAQPATLPQKYTTNALWWWGVALENSRVYTRRIVLHAQPL